jgi:hypothetical protein
MVMTETAADVRRIHLAAVILLSVVVVGSAVTNGFALDDVHIIFENARVHSLSSFWELFGQTYWPPKEGASLYRPLTMLAFALQWTTGNGSPIAFHIFSSILYAGTCAAFYTLARELASRRVALIAALFFAVHPVHVEVFANVVGQAELWVALLAFAATTVFLRARKRGTPTTRDIVIITVLYFAACMFKEHAIVLPALLAAAELFVARFEVQPKRTREIVPLLLALLAVGILFVAIRTGVAGGIRAGGSNELFRDQSFGVRFLTMLNVIVEWVRLLFWPAQLSADYSYPRTNVATGFTVSMLPGLLVLAGCVTLAWLKRRTNPLVTFGLLWIVVTLLIPSNLVIVTGFVLAERTLFLASAGVMLLLASGGVYLWESFEFDRRRQLAVAAAGCLALFAGAARSWQRGPVWHDNRTLFEQTVRDVPSSSRAHWMLAEHLSKHSGPRAAIDEMMLAVALGKKNDATLLGFAADQLVMAGMYRRASELYLQALRLTPGNSQLRANMSLCLLRLGRIDEARSVAMAAPAAVTANPRLARVIALSDSLAAARGARASGATRPN